MRCKDAFRIAILYALLSVVLGCGWSHNWRWVEMTKKADIRNHAKRLAEELLMFESEVNQLQDLARIAGRFNEHACNGDPHPGNENPEDKNKNSELWNDDRQTIQVAMQVVMRDVKPQWYVVFTGIYPCLHNPSTGVYRDIL